MINKIEGLINKCLQFQSDEKQVEILSSLKSLEYFEDYVSEQNQEKDKKILELKNNCEGLNQEIQKLKDELKEISD